MSRGPFVVLLFAAQLGGCSALGGGSECVDGEYSESVYLGACCDRECWVSESVCVDGSWEPSGMHCDCYCDTGVESDANSDVDDALQSDADTAPDVDTIEADTSPPPPPNLDGSCAAYGDPVEVGALPDTVIETSGIVASRRHAGIYWGHPDSGREPAVFGFDQTGALVAELRMQTADGEAIVMGDWEDIAAGPCAPDGSGDCLYVGNIGDNSSGRDAVEVFRVAEPDALGDHLLVAERMTFTYESGPRDAEALFVDDDATVYVVTKRPGEARVMRIPFAAGEGLVAADLGELGEDVLPGPHPPLVTGADYLPEIGKVLLRTYVLAIECTVDPDDPGALDAWSCREVPSVTEFADEAIAWDGVNAYVHVSELEGASVWRVTCAE